MKEIKDIASRYTPDEIEFCIREQIEKGRNFCIRGEEAERIVGELSKASFVKKMMEEKGLSLADALRELAKRIRETLKLSETGKP